MKINDTIELNIFANSLETVFSTRSIIGGMYLKRKELSVIETEKRKVIRTCQTFSLDSDYISHVEELIKYELSVEYLFNHEKTSDNTLLEFNSLDSLNKAEQFFKDNFRFIKKS